MRTGWLRASVWIGATLLLGWMRGVATWGTERQLVDRIVAVVDDDPILASEVEQVFRLGLLTGQQETAPEEGYAAEQARRGVLDDLIEQRLRFHAVDRFGWMDLPPQAVEEQVQRVRNQFSGDAAFLAELDRLALTENGLRQLLARQLLVVQFVEERLGARVFVDLEDIRSYYDETFVPEMRKLGQEIPPIEAVREEIRSVLREQRLNEEIERWTEELRLAADVEDYWNREIEETPPVVLRIEAAGDDQ